MPETFGDWLRLALDKKGWSQGQLAIRVGVSPSTVSRWLTGGRPDPEYAGRLAKAFGEPLAKVYAVAGHPADYAPPERQPLSQRDATIEFLSRQPIEIPIVEQLASAGAGQQVLDYVYLPPSRATSRNLIGVRVKGQSMEPDILDGDTLIIDREIEARPGHIVVATVGDETFVKRLEKKAGHLVLTGNNGAMPGDDAEIAGVVIQVIHDVPH